MQTACILFSLTLASSAFAAAPASLAASGPLTVASAAVDEKSDEFKAFIAEFEQAQTTNSKARMTQLVRSNQQFTIWWVGDTCRLLANRTDDQLEKLIADLRHAWREAFDSSFVNNLYEYYSLLRGPRRQSWLDMDAAHRELIVHESKAETDVEIERAGLGFRDLAERFEEIGDAYMAATCWLSFALAMDEPKRGENADLYAACEGYGRALANYEKVDLTGPNVHATKNRHQDLVQTGYDGEKGADGGAAAPAAPGAPPVDSAAGAATTLELEFEPVREFDAFQRPFFALDENYQTWSQLELTETGSSTTFVSRPEGPIVLRTGASEIMVDVDRDGSGEVAVPITGNFELVELESVSNGKQEKLAFFATIGLEQDVYQRAEVHLGPSDQYFGLYFVPASSVVTSLGGIELRIFDDNFDGKYGSEPWVYKPIGTTSASIGHAEFDSVAIAGAERAQPWSEYLSVGGAWYKMEHTEAGELQAVAVTPKLGRLALDFKGGSPTWLIVSGLDGLAKSYFDLAEAGKKGIEVPVGRYQVYYGEFRKGKKREEMKALITRSQNPRTYTVSEGETTTLELGAPFRFDFDKRMGAGTVTVVGNSVAVLGRGDERYERLWNCRAAPEASWREEGSKRGSKPKDMELVMNQFEIQEAGGWQYFWFPSDLELKVDDDAAVEVQLVEKKNKLFGKIESEWK